MHGLLHSGISERDVGKISSIFKTLRQLLPASASTPMRGTDEYQRTVNRPNNLDDARQLSKKGDYCFSDTSLWPDDAFDLAFDMAHVLFCEAFYAFCDAEDNVVPHCASKHCHIVKKMSDSLFANCDEDIDILNPTSEQEYSVEGFVNAAVRNIEGEKARKLAVVLFDSLNDLVFDRKKTQTILSNCPTSSLYWYVSECVICVSPPSFFVRKTNRIILVHCFFFDVGMAGRQKHAC
jgi:hypothetical protein